MLAFILGSLVGVMVGVGTMSFFAVAAEEDRWLEKKDKERRDKNE